MDHLNAWNAHDLYAITFALRVNLHDTYLRYNGECAGGYNNSVAVVRALFIQHCGGKFARSVAESLRETFVHHLWRHRPVCNVVVSKVAWCFSTQTWLRFRADIADYSPSILDINILAIIVILNMALLWWHLFFVLLVFLFWSCFSHWKNITIRNHHAFQTFF